MAENIMIKTWKETIKTIMQEYKSMKKDFDTKTETKNLARRQKELIEETRPDKNKTAYEQMNKQQKELMDYLTKVEETGEL